MGDAEHQRNLKIDDLLDLWEWCSRRLHVKWQRKPRLRNGVFIGLTHALLGQDSISGPTLLRSMELPKRHRNLARPLLNQKRLRIIWKLKPGSLLELCVGCFTKTSPLTKPLNRLRLTYQNNSILDDLAKKMRGREKRFGADWFTEGHHPTGDVRLLKKEMRALGKELADFMLKERAAIEMLIEEVLAQGWQFREIPAAWLVRRTPENLLNRSIRLKLWQAAQDVLSRNLPDEEALNALCQTLRHKITPSVKSAIEAQGYTVNNVIDDMLNFDMRKSRDEITS